MVVTNLRNSSTKSVLETLRELVPSVSFQEGDTFFWSPQTLTIAYSDVKLETDQGKWSLLHEVAHATLNHKSYDSDFGLLKLEVEAWDKAKKLGKDLKIVMDEEYIQDCLDTYRDWLHRRSTCPTCGNVGLQLIPTEYHCHNCLSQWTVSESRFCRPYRRKMVSKNKKSSKSRSDQTTFQ